MEYIVSQVSKLAPIAQVFAVIAIGAFATVAVWQFFKWLRSF